jgi:hypothetical protein
MGKIAMFPLTYQGMAMLSEFQKTHEIISHRAYRIEDGENRYGLGHIGVLYEDKPTPITNFATDNHGTVES